MFNVQLKDDGTYIYNTTPSDFLDVYYDSPKSSAIVTHVDEKSIKKPVFYGYSAKPIFISSKETMFKQSIKKVGLEKQKKMYNNIDRIKELESSKL